MTTKKSKVDTFELIKREAVRGIKRRLDAASVTCTYHREPTWSDNVSLNFHFGLNQRAAQVAMATQAVVDCAELLTYATRNGWKFDPQLLTKTVGEYAHSLFVVPVPMKHESVLKLFATETKL